MISLVLSLVVVVVVPAASYCHYSYAAAVAADNFSFFLTALLPPSCRDALTALALVVAFVSFV